MGLSLLGKGKAWFGTLSQRERIIVSVTILFGVFFLGYLPISFAVDSLESDRTMIVRREADLKNLNLLAERYSELNSRLQTIQNLFSESQMSFEQVTTQIDKIVKESIGSGDYGLKPSPTPEPFGFEYEKQDYTLTINKLSLEQLVKLLHQLEQGNIPLFLRKVEVRRLFGDQQLAATFDIFSLRKSQPLTEES